MIFSKYKYFCSNFLFLVDMARAIGKQLEGGTDVCVKDKLENIKESSCQLEESNKDENYENQEKQVSQNVNIEELTIANPDQESSPAKQHKQGSKESENNTNDEKRPKAVKEVKTKMTKEELVYRREGERAEAVIFITRRHILKALRHEIVNFPKIRNFLES